jgi:hypothetical protein
MRRGKKHIVQHRQWTVLQPAARCLLEHVNRPYPSLHKNEQKRMSRKQRNRHTQASKQAYNCTAASLVAVLKGRMYVIPHLRFLPQVASTARLCAPLVRFGREPHILLTGEALFSRYCGCTCSALLPQNLSVPPLVCHTLDVTVPSLSGLITSPKERRVTFGRTRTSGRVLPVKRARRSSSANPLATGLIRTALSDRPKSSSLSK